jgi:hypothetical protein
MAQNNQLKQTLWTGTFILRFGVCDAALECFGRLLEVLCNGDRLTITYARIGTCLNKHGYFEYKIALTLSESDVRRLLAESTAEANEGRGTKSFVRSLTKANQRVNHGTLKNVKNINFN